MKWLILTAVWFFAVDARAQNADVFFHSGAQIYIAGNVEKAVATLREGLRRFPEDERIEELLRKIEERQQDQQQSQQDQQQSQQQGEQQNESEQDRQNDENPGESESERESEDQAPSPAEEQAEPQPEEGRLTPEEARRLLDAMRDREEEAQERHKVKVSGPEYKGKVW